MKVDNSTVLYNATLITDHKCKDHRQVQQWAILIDTGVMTSAAPSDYFPHMPLEPLRAEDSQPRTAVKKDTSDDEELPPAEVQLQTYT
eukprot:394815-Amphidinium_carterae.1